MNRSSATSKISPLRGLLRTLACAVLVLGAGLPAAAQFGGPRPQDIGSYQKGKPSAVKGVDFEQKLGATVPLGIHFRDESGREVTLAELGRGKPIVLVPAYYHCPMLCPLVITGVASSLETLKLDVGKDYSVIVVSIDPKETAKMASEAKAHFLHTYDRPGAAQGAHFLTGDDPQIHAVMDTIGFHYNYLPEKDQYAHAAGIVVLTPEGKVARYFYGVEYPPRDVRLGLVDASGEKIGSLVDKVILYCCTYDPTTGRYSAAILNIVRLGGVLTLVALGLFFFLSWRHGKHHTRTSMGEA
jgi:protein SCO1/2